MDGYGAVMFVFSILVAGVMIGAGIIILGTTQQAIKPVENSILSQPQQESVNSVIEPGFNFLQMIAPGAFEIAMAALCCFGGYLLFTKDE